VIWVLDASVAVRWLLEDETDENADSVLKRLVDEPRLFAVPELFAFEVYAVLERLHPDGLRAFKEAIIPILHGGMLRHPMTESLVAGANRFVAKGLTGYDACYASLAKELRGLWLTFDKKAHAKVMNLHVSHLLSEGMPPGW